jgi:hypothetical protein
MNIGKLIADALMDALGGDESMKGPELPLNEKARAIHDEYCDFVDDIVPQVRRLELELTKLKNRIDERRKEWSLAMAEAQSELGTGQGFEITQNKTMYRIVYENEEEAAAAAATATNGLEQPDWVKRIPNRSKPN